MRFLIGMALMGAQACMLIGLYVHAAEVAGCTSKQRGLTGLGAAIECSANPELAARFMTQ